MKCFTVGTEVVAGIATSTDPFLCVRVGEPGRGRRLSPIPLGQRDFPENPGRLTTADVLVTREKKTHLLVKERSPSNRALVLLATPAGFRGSTSWSALGGKPSPCHRRGRIEYASGKCPLCGVQLSSEGEYSWRHPNEGDVNTRPLAEGCKVVAEGHCAQGDAGRMGGHAEYLVIVEPGTKLEVRRGGRLYGANPVLHVYWDGTELHVGPPHVVCQVAFEDEEGEVI